MQFYRLKARVPQLGNEAFYKVFEDIKLENGFAELAVAEIYPAGRGLRNQVPCIVTRRADGQGWQHKICTSLFAQPEVLNSLELGNLNFLDLSREELIPFKGLAGFRLEYIEDAVESSRDSNPTNKIWDMLNRRLFAFKTPGSMGGIQFSEVTVAGGGKELHGVLTVSLRIIIPPKVLPPQLAPLPIRVQQPKSHRSNFRSDI